MVIMIGPPASGKGFFLERGKAIGKGLPESTKGLFTDDQIPDEKLGIEESDNKLRAIQYATSFEHFFSLKEAYEKGEGEFNKVLDDMWYKTKDGDVRKLKDFVDHKSFDKGDHQKFFTKQTKAFYQSMRGWHSDADEINLETGKMKERFKDEARKMFEKSVKDKVLEGSKQMLIVDSAGEDIDAQDFAGQISVAKSAGYEVTVIALDPEKEDTSLSNMNRGFIGGKRMVDQQDIDNYYEKYEKALADIKKAVPHNFLHYKKPPVSDDDRKRLVNMMTKTPDGKPTFVSDPSSKIRTVDDLDGGLNTPAKKKEMSAYRKAIQEWEDGGKKGEEPKKPKRGGLAKEVASGVGKTLFAKDYELDTKLSFGVNLKGVQKNPYFKDDNEGKEKPKKSKDKGGLSDKWLEKRVTNPETGNKVKIKTLKSKPHGSQGHHFYLKLKEERKKAASSVIKKIASRLVLSTKVAYRVYHEKYNNTNSNGVIKMSSRALQQMMDAMGQAVLKGLPETFNDYKVEMKTDAGYGPSIFFTLKGAEGDATTSREFQAELAKRFDQVIKREHGGLFTTKTRGINKVEDLLIEVEVIFPA